MNHISMIKSKIDRIMSLFKEHKKRINMPFFNNSMIFFATYPILTQMVMIPATTIGLMASTAPAIMMVATVCTRIQRWRGKYGNNSAWGIVSLAATYHVGRMAPWIGAALGMGLTILARRRGYKSANFFKETWNDFQTKHGNN